MLWIEVKLVAIEIKNLNLIRIQHFIFRKHDLSVKKILLFLAEEKRR